MRKAFGRLAMMGPLAAGILLSGNTTGAGEPMKTNDTAVNQTKITLPAILTWDAWGDSITQGGGNHYSYVPSVEKLNPSWTVRNHGIGGQQVSDYAPVVHMANVTTNSVNSLLIGTGDAIWGSGPVFEDIFYHKYLDLAAWLAVANEKKKVSGSGDITTNGAWSTSYLYNGLISGKSGQAMLTTSHQGASLTVTNLIGTAILFSVLRSSDHAGTRSSGGGSEIKETGAFTLYVDGTPYGSYNTMFPTNTVSESSPSRAETAQAQAYAIAITNLSSGTHTVTMVKTAPGGTVTFIWAASMNNAQQWGNGPYFYAAGLLPETAAWMAGHAAWGNSTETLQRYNAIIARICADLVRWGANAVYIDTFSSFDPDTMTISDGLHVNELGAAQVAVAFNSAFHPAGGIAAWSAGPIVSAGSRGDNMSNIKDKP